MAVWPSRYIGVLDFGIFLCNTRFSDLADCSSGDSPESWGFGGTGKKSTDRKYFDYGVPFGKGDVIGVVIDLDALTISYTRNGQFLGVAFELPPRVRDTGLFPHVYVKNVDFQVNFKEETKWFAAPGTGLAFLGDADPAVRILNNSRTLPCDLVFTTKQAAMHRPFFGVLLSSELDGQSRGASIECF